MTGANGLSRPAPGIARTVTKFGRSLALNQRRQTEEENAQAKRISYSHGGSKTLRDSQKSVKAEREEEGSR
jgi:hypothetical protein